MGIAANVQDQRMARIGEAAKTLIVEIGALPAASGEARRFQEMTIRHLKGILKAWEQMLKETT